MAKKGVARRVGRPSRKERLTGETAAAAGIDRRQLIVETSARLFAEKGFDRTSIRDIAAAAGILSGSLYYYFKSKEEIFVEVHSQGMKRLTDAADVALASETDPWKRLEALAAAHSRVLLEGKGFMLMVAPSFPDLMGDQLEVLMEQRNAYEKIVAGVVADLELSEGINADMFRLQFLGALNWAQTWYRPGRGLSPEDIGSHLVRMLHHGAE